MPHIDFEKFRVGVVEFLYGSEEFINELVLDLCLGGVVGTGCPAVQVQFDYFDIFHFLVDFLYGGDQRFENITGDRLPCSKCQLDFGHGTVWEVPIDTFHEIGKFWSLEHVFAIEGFLLDLLSIIFIFRIWTIHG
jgi:hypothetical protein